jgi:periplasmic divalent cation tolerance protein
LLLVRKLRKLAVNNRNSVSMQSIIVIFTTFPDQETAEKAARTLVDESLIACATLLPGSVSLYRWKGALERVTEVQVIMKTAPSRVTDVRRRVTELHPYDVPEFVAVESVDALPDYAAWVQSATNRDDP